MKYRRLSVVVEAHQLTTKVVIGTADATNETFPIIGNPGDYIVFEEGTEPYILTEARFKQMFEEYTEEVPTRPSPGHWQIPFNTRKEKTKYREALRLCRKHNLSYPEVQKLLAIPDEPLGNKEDTPKDTREDTREDTKEDAVTPPIKTTRQKIRKLARGQYFIPFDSATGNPERADYMKAYAICRKHNLPYTEALAKEKELKEKGIPPAIELEKKPEHVRETKPLYLGADVIQVAGELPLAVGPGTVTKINGDDITIEFYAGKKVLKRHQVTLR